MKIVEIPFGFAPDPVGGTEVYVNQLAHDLEGLGVETLIAAPGKTSESYVHEGLHVRRYALSPALQDPIEIYGNGDPVAAREFATLLDDEKPNLVHLHAYTRGVSLRIIRAARERGLPVVLTYHTPTVSCVRGTLMLYGEELCDGRMDVTRCTGCTLHGLGMNELLAAGVGRLSPKLGRWLQARGLRGGVWTALRMSDLVRVRHESVRAMMAEIDHLVAVCAWARDVLLLNGAPEEKVSVCRHGISWIDSELPERIVDDTLRLAFLGRFDRTKGLNVVIEAFRTAPDLPARLDVYGIAQGESGRAYRDEMLAIARDDPRINFRDPIPFRDVVARLRGYDFLVVPSQWLETGPLVALEAFAAGTPVIGWRLGGITELVEHERNGLLIEPDRKGGWVAALRRVAGDPVLRARLRSGVTPPRRSIEVARDMLGLYERLLSKRSPSRAGTTAQP